MAGRYIRQWSDVTVRLGAMVVVAACLTGCATFGSRAGLPAHAKSIAIPVFRNKTLEYGAEEDVTGVVVHEFIKDGRLTVRSSENADLVLEGTIVEYEITPAGYDRDSRVSNSTVRAVVVIKLIDKVAGKTLIDGERFRTSGSFFETSEPSKRRTEDVFIRMADDIISRVIEGW